MVFENAGLCPFSSRAHTSGASSSSPMARFRWCARWIGRPEARRRTSLLYQARTSTPQRRTRSSAGRIWGGWISEWVRA